MYGGKKKLRKKTDVLHGDFRMDAPPWMSRLPTLTFCIVKQKKQVESFRMNLAQLVDIEVYGIAWNFKFPEFRRQLAYVFLRIVAPFRLVETQGP